LWGKGEEIVILAEALAYAGFPELAAGGINLYRTSELSSFMRNAPGRLALHCFAAETNERLI